MIGLSCLLSAACACAHLSTVSVIPYVCCHTQALLPRLFLLCSFAFCQPCLIHFSKLYLLECRSHALFRHAQTSIVYEHPLLIASLTHHLYSLLQPLTQMCECCSAYRDVDESEQDFMGSKLVVSFANPAKHYDNHAIRPQNNGSGSALVGGTNGKLGLRGNSGAASGLLTGRSGLGSKSGFNDRLSPTGPFPNARGRCYGSLRLSLDDSQTRLLSNSH